MGCCFSKKPPSSSSSSSSSFPAQDHPKTPSSCSIIPVKNKKKIGAIGAEAAAEKSLLEQNQLHQEDKEQVQQQQQQQQEKPVPRKDEFIIHQGRNSPSSEPKCPADSDASVRCGPIFLPNPPPDDGNTKGGHLGTGATLPGNGGSALLRATSSCTKEEVDAILIPCGGLSRNNSPGKGTSGASSRKYAAGSKRSHDFDSENLGPEDAKRKLGVDPCLEEYHCDGDGDDEVRGRRRESARPSREGTPSYCVGREKGKDDVGGRRLSRSPGRRSESPIRSNARPGKKLASVPATVSSLSIDKDCRGEAATSSGNAKKTSVMKRNVGGEGGSNSRGSASPRSRGHGGGGKLVNDNINHQQQAQQFSHNPSSRKAEHSPHRRTPLNEIDTNSLQSQPLTCKPKVEKGGIITADEKGAAMAKQPTNTDTPQNMCFGTGTGIKVPATQGKHRRTGSRGGEGNECFVAATKLQDTEQLGNERGEHWKTAGADTMRSLTRRRSSRRSQDLDMDVEALLNPNTASSYNSLLLQDIRNFHQSTNNPNSKANAFSVDPNTDTDTKIPLALPPCLSKACSILQAVADLNSSTNPYGKESNFYFSANPAGKMQLPEEVDEPFVVETQVNLGDDLMEPSIHKYVTIRKKGIIDEEQESSGSNSYLTTRQLSNWGASSSTSWEPNSADSPDCWKS